MRIGSNSKLEVEGDFISKFNQLCEKIDKIEERMEDVGKMKDVCTGMETKMENFGKEVNQIRQREERAKHRNAVQRNAELRAKMREMDQYSSKPNQVIHGIPQDNNEVARNLIMLLASKLKVRLNEYDICAAHRLPSKGKTAPIIVRLNNYDRKRELLVEAKKK